MQSPDFYGILASWMVGRFGRKVGRSGKKFCFLSYIYKLGEEIDKNKEKITYLLHVSFPPFSISSLMGLTTLNFPLFFVLYQLNSEKYVSKCRLNPAKSRKNQVCPFRRLGRLDRFLDSDYNFLVWWKTATSLWQHSEFLT